MNTTKRIKVLKEISRIHNMLTASRHDVLEFASKKTNKSILEQMLRDLALAILPDYKTRRPPLKRWEVLTDKQKLNVRRRIGFAERSHTVVVNKLVNMGFLFSDAHFDRQWNPITCEIVNKNASMTRPSRVYNGDNRWASPGNVQKRQLHKKTPSERLQEQRRFKISSFIYLDEKDKVAFIPNLHPDDAEAVGPAQGLDRVHIYAAREILHLNKLFLDTENIIAAKEYLKDPDTICEVYYVATLRRARYKKDNDIILERFYIGRCTLPRTGRVKITSHYKTASGALVGAQKFFAESISQIIYREKGANI